MWTLSVVLGFIAVSEVEFIAEQNPMHKQGDSTVLAKIIRYSYT